jgi:hypothetical protein
LIDKLVAARLVDRDNDTLRIHNWEKWQSTPHQSARIDAENEPKAPKLVRPTGDKSRTYGPTDRQKEKGSAAARERSGRSTERPKSAARLKWETDFRKADPAGYARAIELEIFDADLVLADRITSAELREPGEGVRMAREALRQWAQVNRAPI